MTFDSPGLPVAMKVWDITGTPALVAGPTAMSNTDQNTYVGFFTPTLNRLYLILKSVYTDGTFVTLDQNYSQGSESIVAISLVGAVPGSSIMGVVGNAFPHRQEKAIDIIQGSKSSFLVRLYDGNSLPDPYDLTGVTAITACFTKKDGTELGLSLGSGLSLIDAKLGKVQVDLTAAQTGNLNQVDVAALELAITFSGDPIKVQILNAYNVLLSIC